MIPYSLRLRALDVRQPRIRDKALGIGPRAGVSETFLPNPKTPRTSNPNPKTPRTPLPRVLEFHSLQVFQSFRGHCFEPERPPGAAAWLSEASKSLSADSYSNASWAL